MPRSVYFAFDYEDVKSFRANVVRNSYVCKKLKFKDSSIWEDAKEKRVGKIKELIDNSLIGTSVNCVLIGTETYNRRYVRYEIVKSFTQKKGLLGVGINWIKDKNGEIKFWPGKNPFEYLKLTVSEDGKDINFFEYKNGWIPYKDLLSVRNFKFKEDKFFGRTIQFTELFKCYSYDWNNGKVNLATWIENAAKDADR